MGESLYYYIAAAALTHRTKQPETSEDSRVELQSAQQEVYLIFQRQNSKDETRTRCSLSLLFFLYISSSDLPFFVLLLVQPLFCWLPSFFWLIRGIHRTEKRKKYPILKRACDEKKIAVGWNKKQVDVLEP